MNGNDRSIVGLVMLAHGMVHTFELSIPIFVSIWLAEFDVLRVAGMEVAVTQATLGLLVTAGYALFGLGALPGGIVVDRVGSRRLIAACLFGMSGAFLLLGTAPNLLVVALALLLWGTAASVYHPAGLTLISKGVSDRGTGFAYHGVAGNLGIGLGPLLTTILLIVFDWTTVALVLAVPAVVAGLYALRAEFDETAAVDGVERGSTSSRPTADDEVATDGGGAKAGSGVDSLSELATASKQLFVGAFAVVFVIVMANGLYYRGVLTFLPNLLSGLPGFEPIALSTLVPGLDGGRTLNPERYFYAGLLLVGVAGQYVGGKLTDRMPPEYGIAAVFAVLAVLALAFLPVAAMGIGPLLVLGALFGVTLFTAQPLYQAAVADYTPAGRRGLSYGYTYLGTFGVGALGGALAGAILTYADAGVLFATLAGLAVVASTCAFALVRRGRRDATEA
ncbi:MFS transporter [Haloplanus aerogenes]|uniref:MFS transporter n=1 Tax=Haloplanus aerogenes TaxID=660522 RepID=A0A3M0D8H4_9EURY|nr:MFS transporter [Haloplanus aerogenes]AZH26434.1 MFS transporter [Haloplanus aerogenes]RMB18101.1 sugar phosphate permease [Haloplanus aerogenes]